jgi:hypothetical protein
VGPFESYMGGFPEVPYIASELVQGLEAGATSAELFAYEASYNGSFETPDPPVLHPIAGLYSSLLNDLGTLRYNVTSSPGLAGVELLATNGSAAGPHELLVVNPTADQLDLTFNGSGDPFGSGGVAETSWAQGSPLTNRSWPTPLSGGSATVEVPPYGVARLFASNGALGAATVRIGPAAPLGDPGQGLLTVTRVSVPLMPGIRLIRWTTMSSASFTWPAWIFTMRSNGPVTASTSTTWGTCRTFFRTSSRRPISASTRR